MQFVVQKGELHGLPFASSSLDGFWLVCRQAVLRMQVILNA